MLEMYTRWPKSIASAINKGAQVDKQSLGVLEVHAMRRGASRLQMEMDGRSGEDPMCLGTVGSCQGLQGREGEGPECWRESSE